MSLIRQKIHMSRTLYGFLYLVLLSGCTANQAAPSVTTLTPTTDVINTTRLLPDFTDLVAKGSATVVNIQATQKITPQELTLHFPELPPDAPLNKFFRRFLDPHKGRKDMYTQNLGSGVIISPDGYILTNAHLVANSEELKVNLIDKREFKGKLIGSDTRTDIAVIKIDAHQLPVPPIGDPSKLKVGEWVLAIGSPFGLESSVTAGIVSGKGRSLEDTFVPFIQSDAAVNPGNSGGPLFNLNGEVVGINSQIYSQSGGSMGISFAIPIDLAIDIKNKLLTRGQIHWGKIGINIQQVTSDLANVFKLTKPQGALVNFVEPGGPAARAGMTIGDIILAFNHNKVDDYTDLPHQIANTEPGTIVPVQVWRKGNFIDLQIVITTPTISKTAQRAPLAGAKNIHHDGFGIRELNVKERRQLHTQGHLMIEMAEGEAARAGFQTGDIILAVNDIPVVGFRQFQQLLDKAEQHAALLIQRGNQVNYFSLKLRD